MRAACYDDTYQWCQPSHWLDYEDRSKHCETNMYANVLTIYSLVLPYSIRSMGYTTLVENPRGELQHQLRRTCYLPRSSTSPSLPSTPSVL